MKWAGSAEGGGRRSSVGTARNLVKNSARGGGEAREVGFRKQICICEDDVVVLLREECVSTRQAGDASALLVDVDASVRVRVRG